MSRKLILAALALALLLPGCAFVEKMAEKNKETVTALRDDLIEQGFAPCTRCRP